MFETVRTILGYLEKQERKRFFFLVALRAFNGVFDLLGVMILGYLAASIAAFLSSGANTGKNLQFAGLVLPAVTAKALPIIGVIVVLIFTCKAAFAVLLTQKLALHLARVEARATRNISGVIFGNGIDAMSARSREEVLFAIQVGSSSAFNGVLNSVATIISEGFLFVILLSSFVALSPLATLGLFLFLAVVGAIIQFFIGSRLQNTAKVLTRNNIKANAALDDLYSSFREISVLGKIDFFREKLYESRRQSAHSQAQQTYLLGMPRYIIETALIAGIFAFGFIQSLSGDIAGSISVVGVFLTGGFRILAAMLPFQAAFSNIKSVTPQAQSALTILTAESSAKVPTDYFIDASIDGPLNVVAKDVSFSYPTSSKPALHGINMTIKAGSQVAIIGASGAGKSTIADLLLGLILPSTGSVLLGGQPPSAIAGSGKGSIAYVPQKTGIVSGTIVENIAIGVDSEFVDLKRLERAVAMAHLRELVESLPNGVNTDLGKHSDNLSGGQLQRLGLARAFYTQPKLIIMDEATSGLDAESEYQIGETLTALRGDVTVILIAHRLNTVQHADKVFLIDDGTVADSGSFGEILSRNPSVEKAARLMSMRIE